MALPAGATVIGGIAVSADGAVYVTPTGTASITGGSSKWDDGAEATPSIAFAAATGTGFWRASTGEIGVSTAGAYRSDLNSVGIAFASSAGIYWRSGTSIGSGADTNITRQAAGRPAIMGATALPAGGSASLGLCFSSTSAFGVYVGSGAPSLSAAQGSLYLRSDGSSTSTRAYINNSAGSGTTWTAITTAA